MKRWSNKNIVVAINGSVEERNEALRAIYLDVKLFASIRKHVGNEQDAKDVFQESLVIFDRSVRSGAFKGLSDWHTYFIGIAKWRWLDMRRKKGNNWSELKPEIYDGMTEEASEVALIEGERRTLLEQAIDQLKGDCREVLGLYMLSFSMMEIAEKTGSTESNAKKMAQRCRDKLREYLMNHPALMQILNVKSSPA